MRVETEGADKLRRLARQLREAGDKSLQRELRAGLTRAMQPLRGELVSAVGAYLPGGYAPLVAASLTVRGAATSGRGARIRVVTAGKGRKAKRDIQALNAGVLRHPVFGRYRFVKRSRASAHRDVRSARPWAVQRVRPGFFDDQAAKRHADLVRECESVIDQVARKIEGGS
jgi:hypothetical protein